MPALRLTPVRIIAAFFAITWLIYGSSRCGFLRSDDVAWIRAVEHQQFLSICVEQFTRGSPYDYRPLTSVILWAESHVYGDFAPPYYALNFLLHSGNAWLVYSLAGSILRKRPWAIAAAVIFLVHPAPFRTVVWVSDLATILQTTFTLIAVRAWFEYLRGGRTRWLVASELSAIAAMFAKESGIIVVALLPLCDLLMRRGNVARRLLPYLPLAAAVPVYLHFSLQPIPGWREYPDVYRVSWQIVFNALYGIGFAVVPIAAKFVTAVIGVLFLLITAAVIRSKPDALSLGLWIVLGVLPTAPFAPGGFNETGRYAYSLLAPVSIIIGICLDRLDGAVRTQSKLTKRLVPVATAAAILFALSMTYRLARTPYATQPGVILYHYVVFSVMGYPRAEEFLRAEFRCSSADAVKSAYDWSTGFVERRKDRTEFLLPGLLVRGISEIMRNQFNEATANFTRAEDLAGHGVEIVRGARVKPEFVHSLTSRWRHSPECRPSL